MREVEAKGECGRHEISTPGWDFGESATRRTRKSKPVWRKCTTQRICSSKIPIISSFLYLMSRITELVCLLSSDYLKQLYQLDVTGPTRDIMEQQDTDDVFEYSPATGDIDDTYRRI